MECRGAIQPQAAAGPKADVADTGMPARKLPFITCALDSLPSINANKLQPAAFTFPSAIHLSEIDVVRSVTGGRGQTELAVTNEALFRLEPRRFVSP